MGEARRKQRHQVKWDKKGFKEMGSWTHKQLRDSGLSACRAPRHCHMSQEVSG